MKCNSIPVILFAIFFAIVIVALSFAGIFTVDATFYRAAAWIGAGGFFALLLFLIFDCGIGSCGCARVLFTILLVAAIASVLLGWFGAFLTVAPAGTAAFILLVLTAVAVGATLGAAFAIPALALTTPQRGSR